jgi:DNA-binding MarR family transcriptional regulator
MSASKPLALLTYGKKMTDQGADDLAMTTGPKQKRAVVNRPAAERFRFGYLVHDVSRIRRTVMDHALRPLGITRSQWSVLSALSRGGNDGMMQVDLARLLEVGKVTVGGLVDRLEAAGQVERRSDATDRRAKRVYITEQGYEVIRQMILVATELNDRILGNVSPKDQQVAEEVLFKVKENLKNVLRETS